MAALPYYVVVRSADGGVYVKPLGEGAALLVFSTEAKAEDFVEANELRDDVTIVGLDVGEFDRLLAAIDSDLEASDWDEGYLDVIAVQRIPGELEIIPRIEGDTSIVWRDTTILPRNRD